MKKMLDEQQQEIQSPKVSPSSFLTIIDFMDIHATNPAFTKGTGCCACLYSSFPPLFFVVNSPMKLPEVTEAFERISSKILKLIDLKTEDEWKPLERVLDKHLQLMEKKFDLLL